MRLIIAGSRSFDNYDLLKKSVHRLFYRCTVDLGLIKNWRTDVEIISGTANGADKMGEVFASENNIPVIKFPADWSNINVPGVIIKYNKFGNPYNTRAGYDRNLSMALYAKIDNGVLLVFWDGKSKGTKDMINIAKKHKLKVFVVKFKLS